LQMREWRPMSAAGTSSSQIRQIRWSGTGVSRVGVVLPLTLVRPPRCRTAPGLLSGVAAPTSWSAALELPPDATKAVDGGDRSVLPVIPTAAATAVAGPPDGRTRLPLPLAKRAEAGLADAEVLGPAAAAMADAASGADRLGRKDHVDGAIVFIKKLRSREPM
jgi:hypothetical protein